MHGADGALKGPNSSEGDRRVSFTRYELGCTARGNGGGVVFGGVLVGSTSETLLVQPWAAPLWSGRVGAGAERAERAERDRQLGAPCRRRPGYRPLRVAAHTNARCKPKRSQAARQSPRRGQTPPLRSAPRPRRSPLALAPRPTPLRPSLTPASGLACKENRLRQSGPPLRRRQQDGAMPSLVPFPLPPSPLPLPLPLPPPPSSLLPPPTPSSSMLHALCSSWSVKLSVPPLQ
ncbi:hypothetical protein BDZ91DRAFT_760091 [Kalaharituber pfeilii]|nr:hypothetical protein BDZ91DRAFT_760091 [Kalaharituber pfeilii]